MRAFFYSQALMLALMITAPAPFLFGIGVGWATDRLVATDRHAELIGVLTGFGVFGLAVSLLVIMVVVAELNHRDRFDR